MRRTHALAILVISCGGTPAPREATPPAPILAATVPSAPASTSERTPTAPRQTSLAFELNGRAFPLPVVHATVSGQPVWLLVDTGANSNVIARHVAQKAGLPMRALGDVGSDHTGRAVAAYSVEHPDVVVDGWGSIADGPMLVTDVPEPIARIGIGGFLSPQWLAERGDAVVLDLPAREMRTAPWDDAVSALSQRGGRTLTPGGSRVCADDGSAIKGLAFVLPAKIDGRAVQLLLDTGAHRTDLLTTSRAGKALVANSAPSHEQMYAASGRVKTRVVKGAEVRVGEWSMTTDIDLVPGISDPACPRDGVVSMDLLGACVIVLSRAGVLGRCGTSD